MLRRQPRYCGPKRKAVSPMRIILTMLFVGLAGSAQADPIPMSPELKAFVIRPEQQQAVFAKMVQQWRAIIENCPSPKLQSMNVFVATAPTFDTGGTPISGEWRMVGRFEGCDEARILNVEYLFTPDRQMKALALLPGTTTASLQLEHDGLPYAAMSMAKLAHKDCRDIKYVDTKFTGYQGTDSTAGTARPWTEDWTVRACGVTGIVTMHFTPDATGTNITTKLNETRLLNP
jgi:hypothetical protein